MLLEPTENLRGFYSITTADNLDFPSRRSSIEAAAVVVNQASQPPSLADLETLSDQNSDLLKYKELDLLHSLSIITGLNLSREGFEDNSLCLINRPIRSLEVKVLMLVLLKQTLVQLNSAKLFRVLITLVKESKDNVSVNDNNNNNKKGLIGFHKNSSSMLLTLTTKYEKYI